MTSTHYRSHSVGEIDKSMLGSCVHLIGWVDRIRDHGGVTFIDLRDASGLVQVVINDEQQARGIKVEDVIQVEGKVRKRPEGEENSKLANGEVEVEASKVQIVSEAATLPFQVSTSLENSGELNLPSEETRLRYRYLDLRRASMRKVLRTRSDMAKAAREALDSMGFMEVETPTLIKSTPEGARDFLVPARLSPGNWYALPQSPQLLKQLLMIGGVERYYQFARCYRDEDFRADRQPEFTQLDIEMGYAGKEDVMAMAEAVMRKVWAVGGIDIGTLEQMPWKQAMDEYGSDKPDIRFGNKLKDLTDFFKSTPFRVFQAPYVGAVLYPGGASLPRRQFDAWQDWAKQKGAKGLAYIVFRDGELLGPVAKNISEEERAGIMAASGAKDGDALFFAAGEKTASQKLLGAVRLEIAKRCHMYDPKEYKFLWVVDFPLFKKASEAKSEGDAPVGEGAWTSEHHPFTMPKEEFLDTFDKDPGSVLSDAYDMVCNGNEIGGGSVRIHDQDVQQRVFNVLGIGKKEAEEKFGFLLEALKYGTPPCAGIAFGWDRCVELLTGKDTIREVIAFPKFGAGKDLLTGAPSSITALQRKEAGVDYEQ